MLRCRALPRRQCAATDLAEKISSKLFTARGPVPAPKEPAQKKQRKGQTLCGMRVTAEQIAEREELLAAADEVTAQNRRGHHEEAVGLLGNRHGRHVRPQRQQRLVRLAHAQHQRHEGIQK